MSAKPRFDAAYLENRRQQLIKLRDQLRATATASEVEEAEVKGESSSKPLEYEDDAQRLDTLEIEGNLVGRDLGRLAAIERALQKIADGTYGLSDVSGKAIPDARLEAMPFAINTVEEQEASERTGQQ